MNSSGVPASRTVRKRVIESRKRPLGDQRVAGPDQRLDIVRGGLHRELVHLAGARELTSFAVEAAEEREGASARRRLRMQSVSLHCDETGRHASSFDGGVPVVGLSLEAGERQPRVTVARARGDRRLDRGAGVLMAEGDLRAGEPPLRARAATLLMGPPIRVCGLFEVLLSEHRLPQDQLRIRVRGVGGGGACGAFGGGPEVPVAQRMRRERQLDARRVIASLVESAGDARCSCGGVTDISVTRDEERLMEKAARQEFTVEAGVPTVAREGPKRRSCAG